MDKLSLVAFLVVFVGLVLLVASSRAGLRRLGGLAVTLGLAGAAQWQMLDGAFLEGGLLYTAAVGSLLLWLRFNRIDLNAFVVGGQWSRWQEATAMSAVFGVTALLRLWRVGNVPYGIEQDEGAWTWEIGHQFFSDLRPLGTTYHFSGYPVGFYQGAVFLRLFGLDVVSVRYEMVFLSLVAAVLFYFLVRGLTSVPVALIATFLLGISVVDISASRVGLVEARVKFWIILSFFFFFWALRKNDVFLFLLTGGALAGGMLVYRTFYLMPLVVVLFLVVVALRERYRWREHALALLAISLPLVFAASRVTMVARAERGYASGDWFAFTTAHPYDSFPEKFVRIWQYTGQSFGETMHSLFLRQRWPDFIMVRLDGPIVLAAVVSFALLGVVIALVNVRRGAYAFVLLWLLLGLFVAPLSTGAAYVRVFFPGFPAIYILAAMAVSFVLTAIYRNAGRLRGYAYGGVLCLFAVLLVAVCWHIYFNEVVDPVDRQQRREMLDFLSAGAETSDMLLLPYLPGRGDTLDVEVDGVRFAVGGRWGLDSADDHYRLVPYDDLLPSIAKEDTSRPLTIVYHKTLGFEHEVRMQAIDAVARCYPDREVREGQFFDLITIYPEQLVSSRCYSIGGVVAQSPSGLLPPALPAGVSFHWEGAGGAQRSFRLVLERMRDDVAPLEAEDVFVGPGWYEDPRFGPGHTGRSFLIDDWKAGRAEGVVRLREGGRYWVWLRFDQRVLNDSQAFFYVDGRQLPFGAAGLDELDKWIWKGLGPFDLAQGEHTLGIEKTYGKDPHMGLFFDSLIITNSEAFDPNRDDIWQVVFDSGEVDSAESRFVLDAAADDCTVCTPDGLAPGRYRWRAQVFDGERLVDTVGDRGVWSEYAEFQVGSPPSLVEAAP
jgi:hypothetical protein